MPNPVMYLTATDFCNHYSDGRDTSEFYQDGEFYDGPPLPVDMAVHCTVEVESGFVFISGNFFPGSDKVYGFDPETEIFENLAAMTRGRYSHGCGVVDKGDS